MNDSYTLATKNTTRQRVRDSNTPKNVNNFTFVNRTNVRGGLAENLESLKSMSQAQSNSDKMQHLQAIINVGTFLLSNGPVVKTQDAGEIYMKYKGLVTKKPSMEYYEVFCKYLNVVQVYMFGTAYLMENVENLESIVNSLNRVIDEEAIVKRLMQDRLQSIFSPSLRYMDTHRDRQVLKGLMVELTNTTFVAKLQNIQSRKGARNANKSLFPNLKRYEIIRKTSQTVRNDLTNVQQYKLTERIISSRKLKEIKTIGEGRGRTLKCQEFPELATVLSYAFGEHDVNECGGGGVEAHPRLTTGTLY